MTDFKGRSFLKLLDFSTEEIAALLRSRGAPDEIARRLEKAVVDAGAGDNYSMICLEVRRR